MRPPGQQKRGGEQEDPEIVIAARGPVSVATMPKSIMRVAWTSLLLALHVLRT
jgi:hypothetical protein